MNEQVNRVVKFIQSVKHINPIVFLVILSKSEDVLLYEYTPNGQTCMSSTWISKEHGRVALTQFEDELFGFDMWQNAGRILLAMKRMRSRVFELVLDSEGVAACIGVLNSRSVRMEYATVEFEESIPKEITIVGRAMDGGEEVREKFPVSMFS